MEIRAEINTFTLSKQETNQESIVVSIDIAWVFVLHLSKIELKQYRNCTAERNGPGGI